MKVCRIQLIILSIYIYIVFGISISFIKIYAQSIDNVVSTNEPITIPLPQAVLLNWKFSQITEEEKHLIKKSLEDAWIALENAWLTNPTSLASYLKDYGILPEELTYNQQILAQNIKVGDLKTLPQPRALALQPIITTLADHYVIFIQIADLSLNTLISSSHAVIPKYLYPSNIKNYVKSLEKNLETTIMNIFNQLIEKINTYQFNSPDSALHIGLSLIKENQNLDVGSLATLNLLLEEKLTEQKFSIVRSFGVEDLNLFKYLIKSDLNFRRHTRIISTNWILKNSLKEIKFPLEFSLEANFSESLFGNRINSDIHKAEYVFSIENNKINFNLDEQMMKFLNEEKQALSFKDLPQVAKVYGAWVYLDKGRAYGLVINHRLKAKADDGEIIEGHVVGYFGPYLKLSSPKGYKINDGAIVFIRKGQNKTKIGQIFEYDQTQYPTPWPPQTSQTTQK